jgi:tetratricopeptide (TPR) repeat protein
VSIILGYDPTTLREKVDLVAAGERLDELGEQRNTAALNEKIGLLRLVGRIDEAWDIANQALRQARFSGDREQLCLARIRRAIVAQAQGKFDHALIDLTSCATEARDHDWSSVEACALQHRGRVHFDLTDYPAALMDFRTAATIRSRIGAPASDIESSLVAVAIAESFVDA